jgi:hypothetical protein
MFLPILAGTDITIAFKCYSGVLSASATYGIFLLEYLLISYPSIL